MSVEGGADIRVSIVIWWWWWWWSWWTFCMLQRMDHFNIVRHKRAEMCWISLVAKRSELEADQSSPSSAEEWSYTSAPTIRLCGLDRDNWNFVYYLFTWLGILFFCDMPTMSTIPILQCRYFYLIHGHITVGIVTRLRARRSGIRIPAGTNGFSIFRNVHPFVDPPSLLFNGHQG